MKFSPTDERWMRRALALARRGVGKTSPNPAVGAVLVRGGRVIGEGYHHRAGGPHAEIEALRDAGVTAEIRDLRSKVRDPMGEVSGLKSKVSSLKSAVLYVTLEPCCTWGRTPPCTEAIIAAGIGRVVVAARDPNPRHNGRGLERLRRAGIRVESGLLAEEATRLNEAFNNWIVTGRPLVVAKAAMSLDGKIATWTGDSKWITSEAARREAHRWRARVDAVMVGAGTVRRDDPRLTLRHGVTGRQPWRVVVDARGRCPRDARVFTDSLRARTMVITTRLSAVSWRRYLGNLGISVLLVRHVGRPGDRAGVRQAGVGGRGGRVDLRAALRALGKREITSVLVEGGGELLGAMFDGGLVNRVVFFYAPVVIGGREAVTAVGGKGVERVREAVAVGAGRWRKIGRDSVVFEGRVEI